MSDLEKTLRTNLNRRLARATEIESLDAEHQIQNNTVTPAAPITEEHHAALDLVEQLLHLGVQQYEKYRRNGVLVNLELATHCFQDVLCYTPRDHPNRALHLEYHGMGLLAWHQRVEAMMSRNRRMSIMQDLECAIEDFKEAFSLTSNKSTRARQLQRLGDAYREGYYRTLERTLLHRAVHCYQTATNITPQVDTNRAGLLQSLGLGYHERYKAADSEEDLLLATVYFQEALNQTRPDHEDFASRLQCIGTTYQDMYQRGGALKYLDDGIQILQRALRCTSRSRENRASLFQCLGTAYADRYKRTAAIMDVESAIQYDQKALELTDDDHPQRIYRLHNLAMRLQEKFKRTGDLQDIEKAIQLHHDADSLTPYDSPDPGAPLRLLGMKYQDKYNITNLIEDLDTAIWNYIGAVESQVDNFLDRASRLQSLGLGYYEKYKAPTSRDGQDYLSTAIEHFQQALDLTPNDHPDRASRLHCLGLGYRDVYSQSQAINDMEIAIQLFEQGLALPVSPPADRFACGRDLISLYADAENWRLAYKVAVSTTSLIPLLVLRSLQSSDKQYVLNRVAGFASDAAAVALNAGKGPNCAIELLEMGRVILATSIQDMRTDLSALRKEYPELAQSFVELRNQLDPPDFHSSAITAGSNIIFHQPEADRRHLASNHMQLLLEKIRTKPGFSRFLLSPSEADIKQVAAGGPIVIVNVSSYRCDALIIEPSAIRVQELLKASLREIRVRELDIRSHETLEWLWDALVLPVFNALGFDKPSSGNTWPRVFWIPTGLLVQFPLHLAGYHLDGRFDTALDRVVSSYSPSIKAIIHSGLQHGQEVVLGLEKRVVLIAMKDTPGQKRLKHARNEVDVVKNICESMELPCVQPQPRKMEVSRALEDCSIFHFSGHGDANEANPLRSLLMLEDWKKDPLTLESMLSTNLSSESPFLAYLSACGTSQIRHQNSTDESIHLASAFQLAGFRHVIGTLWEVDDELCVQMGKLTYEFLRENGISDKSVSSALHHATRQLRDEWAQLKGGGQRREGSATQIVQGSGEVRDIEVYERRVWGGAYWIPYVHYGV
ncbi:CHAT domain-containing protein [Xylaria cubensis]|nr:CHAT domain-containing protein [Xylaria cubensis]